METRSSSCPSPNSTAAFAPSERIDSNPDSDKSTPPLAEGPAGILPLSLRPSFFISRRSFCCKSKAHNRTPQLMSNPTPPGEMTPPLSMSVATTPPMGNPYPKWKSAIAHALPTTPGNDAVLANCPGDSSVCLLRCSGSATIIASTFIAPCFLIRCKPVPADSICSRQSSLTYLAVTGVKSRFRRRHPMGAGRLIHERASIPDN